MTGRQPVCRSCASRLNVTSHLSTGPSCSRGRGGGWGAVLGGGGGGRYSRGRGRGDVF